jgi:hypothetical protein
LIKIDQNSINSFEGETCVQLYYMHYTDYITIETVCVLSSKKFDSFDTLIILLAHGRYA